MLSRAQVSLKNAMSAHEKTKSLLKGVEEQLALSRNAVVEVGAGVAGAVDIAFGRMQAQLRGLLRWQL